MNLPSLGLSKMNTVTETENDEELTKRGLSGPPLSDKKNED